MTILYTGLNPPQDPHIVHCPFIQIVPKKPPQDLAKAMNNATHLIFTSKSAVEIYFSLPYAAKLPCFAVGGSTKKLLIEKGITDIHVPQEETAEGLVALLEESAPSSPFFIWPHSALSRDVIPQFLNQKGLNYYDCALYDTRLKPPEPLPLLDQFEEIIFTSPSTVDSFIHAYGYFPSHTTLTPIGPITAKRLNDLQRTLGVCKN